VSQYQKGKNNLDFTEEETVSGSGISWVICKSAPCFRQIATPAPHHSVFCWADALPAAQPTASSTDGIGLPLGWSKLDIAPKILGYTAL